MKKALLVLVLLTGACRDWDHLVRATSEDGGTSDDMAAPKLMFVTSQTFFASLSGPEMTSCDLNASKLEIADCECNRAAARLSIQDRHSFHAWISDDGIAAATRVGRGPWVMPCLGDSTSLRLVTGVEDGKTVFSALTPLNCDETGRVISDETAVWTGSDRFGNTVMGTNGVSLTCENWTLRTGKTLAGNLTVAGEAWTKAPMPPVTCSGKGHLYCLED